MTGHGEKMSRMQERAVVALLSHSSMPEAAKALGIAEKTLWRWTQQNDFKEAFRQARAEVVRKALVQVQTGMSEAVNTLREVMVREEAPASAKVAAARAMLDLGLRAVEVENLEARVDKIEAEMKGRSVA